MARVNGRGLDVAWENEVPSGSVNGSNTSFTLSATPLHSKSVILLVDGLAQIYTTDYSVSGTTITTTYAPAAGSLMLAIYPRKN